MKNNILVFKGIKFYNFEFERIMKKINRGGYLVAPAASALTNLDKNNLYHTSLKKSDIAIFDSGFFCILLRFFKKKKIKKFSGYLFLKKFFNLSFKKNIKFFLVDPSKTDSYVNGKYLKSKKIHNFKSYIAPFYKDKIEDKLLLKKINKYKPNYVLINLGGEVQEILAMYIKQNTKYKVAIFCTGAAIAFLTKRQAPINEFVDKLYMGWILRLIYNPRRHLLRTIKSLYLIKYFI